MTPGAPEVSWMSGIGPDLVDELTGIGRRLDGLAEPGFREWRTHEYLGALFDRLGFVRRGFDGIPGFIAEAPIHGGPGNTDQGRRIALIADMDGLPGPDGNGDGRPVKPGAAGTDENAHPAGPAAPAPAPREASWIHSCGHHMQTTALYGAARLLVERRSPALERIAFIAAPAEEYIDFERREELRRSGIIRHLSGKQELLERGVFDAYHMVVSTHAAGHAGSEFIGSVLGMGGFRVMRFGFEGRAAHAGAHPHRGVNAQNAAALFLQACAFLRESFDEDHHIRIHPVLRPEEGQSVNIIPQTTRVETYVRAAAPEAIELTAGKLRAAAEGCARAIGATAAIEEVPGYAPFRADRRMHEILRQTTEELGIRFVEELYSSASSDMGDVSQALPSVMLGLPGVNGLFHNPDFRVTDERTAYVLPTVVLAGYLEALVRDS